MFFYSLVQQFSGVSVIRAYVVKIFDEVIIKILVNISNIIIVIIITYVVTAFSCTLKLY